MTMCLHKLLVVCISAHLTAILLSCRFLEAAENGDIGKNGIFTIEEASTKLGTL